MRCPRRSRRNGGSRKEYMQQYYQKHKQVVSCPNCLREFVCLRSLRHHNDKNIHCLVSRLENLWGTVRDKFPEEVEKVEPLLQDELNRIRKLKVKHDSSRENSREEKSERKWLI
jgi:hypothetical protein